MGVLGVVDIKISVFKLLIKLKWAMLMPWPKLSCIGKTNSGCFWKMVAKPTVEEETSRIGSPYCIFSYVCNFHFGTTTCNLICNCSLFVVVEDVLVNLDETSPLCFQFKT